MERKINNTQTISDLLNAFTFGDKPRGKSLSDAVKFSTIVSFWGDIVGSKLAKYTMPTKIKYSKLYISAKNPAVIQEMNFNKIKILEQLNTYSKALSITIKDLVFDYKDYTSQTIEKNLPKDEQIDYYSDKTLEDIKIDENFKNNINLAISKINFLKNEEKDILINKICNAKKAELKRKQIETMF